ncbi:CinA family nicotinamide mononucleotide deamidase-related protein [Immundisolibacter sp.]|uniref:CinA family nicotinamide mononucleotide deamidase-related protein n=1 Tax=Immundisolibacter sp. TaxID=1934948 RepID=UPI0035657339
MQAIDRNPAIPTRITPQPGKFTARGAARHTAAGRADLPPHRVSTLTSHSLTACIVSTGEEVLRGELLDSNSAELSRQLGEAGFTVQLMLTAGDRRGDLDFVLRTSLERADWVFMTGGLGPTEDDLTAEVVGELAGVALEFDLPSWQHVEQRFAEFGIPLTDNNRKQALFPTGAQILANPNGTAPGFVAELTLAGARKRIVALPGPPREMQPMLRDFLASLPQARKPSHSFIRFLGIGESSLAEAMRPWADNNVEVGYRALFPELELKLYDVSAQQMLSLRQFVLERFGDYLLDFSPRSTAELFAMYLTETGQTVAVAESCTGGLVGKIITDLPGASAYFLGGVVSYANSAKHDLLGVDAASIAAHGAVSEPVARQMASGVRERFGADIGLAITGIAGPAGGTDEKPVGTVWLGRADGAGSGARHRQFVRGREWVRIFAAHDAMRWLMSDWLSARWRAAVDGG